MPARAWWVMLGCIACQMDLGFAKDTMDVYMTYIVEELGWGRADFQISGWAILTSYSVLSPAVGYLLDRFGARTVLSAGALALGLTFAGYAGMTRFTHYLLITPLLGVGLVAMGDIPAATIVSRWFERRRGTVIAVVLIGSNIGAAIVNLLAKGFYRGFGNEWRPALLALGLLMVAVVLPFSLWIIRDPRPGELGRASTDPSREPSTFDVDGTSGSPGLSLAGAARTRTFWLIVFALFAYYAYYLFVNRHIIAYLRDNDSFGHVVPPLLVSWLGIGTRDFPELTKSLFEVVGIPGKLLAGLLVDRLQMKNALAWNFVLLAGGSILFPWLGSGDTIWLFIVVHGLGWAAQQVLTPMAIAAAFGLRHMGQIYGTLMIVLFPAHLGPWYAGRIFDLSGSYDGFFPLCIPLNFAAALGLFFLKDHTKRPSA